MKLEEELSKMCNKSTSDCIELAKQLKEAQERINKAIKYIENKWKKDSYYEDIDNCLKFCNFNEFDKEDLLEILKGDK